MGIREDIENAKRRLNGDYSEPSMDKKIKRSKKSIGLDDVPGELMGPNMHKAIDEIAKACDKLESDGVDVKIIMLGLLSVLEMSLGMLETKKPDEGFVMRNTCVDALSHSRKYR